ncbi:MAG: hypothetical protein L0210_10375 [Rhodospirillales bacterium]|nr:hypothetical protein [Rhodospirillales bacterium]
MATKPTRRIGILIGFGLGMSIGTASAEEEYAAQLDALRQSLAKYQDVYAAVRDGYFSTVGCVYYSGEKIDGHMDYANGSMGIHFFNPALLGPVPDPEHPPILLYEPDGEGLRLIGVEWFVPLASGVKERPVLFGQPFQGPMEGHEPLLPKEVGHYDLHAWLFKENPLGMFAPTNPDVTCADKPFALLEQPTRLMPEP